MRPGDRRCNGGAATRANRTSSRSLMSRSLQQRHASRSWSCILILVLVLIMTLGVVARSSSSSLGTSTHQQQHQRDKEQPLALRVAQLLHRALVVARDGVSRVSGIDDTAYEQLLRGDNTPPLTPDTHNVASDSITALLRRFRRSSSSSSPPPPSQARRVTRGYVPNSRGSRTTVGDSTATGRLTHATLNVYSLLFEILVKTTILGGSTVLSLAGFVASSVIYPLLLDISSLAEYSNSDDGSAELPTATTSQPLGKVATALLAVARLPIRLLAVATGDDNAMAFTDQHQQQSGTHSDIMLALAVVIFSVVAYVAFRLLMYTIRTATRILRFTTSILLFTTVAWYATSFAVSLSNANIGDSDSILIDW